MKGPLFSFYGAKWRTVPKYAAPGARIVELFAGSACYASRHADRAVLLVERDPLIAALWRWLVGSSPADVRALPDITADTRVDDLPICQEARWLLGFWLNQGSAQPKKSVPSRLRNPCAPRFEASRMWAARREQTARGVAEIKHWRIFEGEWYDAPQDFGATYFIDPPYQNAGKHYKYSTIDYVALGNFCETLHMQGQRVIVCENDGATWLPFRHLDTVKASTRGGARFSQEAVWP
jgi:16S rRNA G966 N2-methylase RsmD